MSSRPDPIFLRRYEPDPAREVAALKVALGRDARSPALTLVVAGVPEVVSQQSSQAAQERP